MSDIKQQIQAALLERRPLSPSTLKTYTSVLSSLMKKLDKDITYLSQHPSKVVEHIEQMDKPATKKTILSALLVLTGIEEYNAAMRENIAVVTEQYKQHKRNEKLEGKDLSFERVKEKNKELQERWEAMPNNYDRAQDLLIAMLVSGEWQIPRRLMDWTAMRASSVNVDSKKDNFIRGNKFVFNVYKTAHLYHTQTVDIHPQVKKMIARINKLQPNREYLLVNNKGAPMSVQTLHKKIKSMYGFSVNQLRSTFLTDEVYNDGLLQRLKTVASDMGHSMQAAQEFYVKN